MSACINWWNKSVYNLSALIKYICGFFFKFIVWYIFESDTLHGSTYIDINISTHDDEDVDVDDDDDDDETTYIQAFSD